MIIMLIIATKKPAKSAGFFVVLGRRLLNSYAKPLLIRCL
jgi:hypothetical protein